MQAFFNAEVKFGYEAGARMRLKFILSKMDGSAKFSFLQGI